ncbi:hypothetical protein [Flavobacterium sp. 25HG05S-40]|uniref:hypothetical protein n=1 Tax=Flavobacterium sp. 25HG05S-40 TaxID=3458682 RepID=UPI0040442199
MLGFSQDEMAQLLRFHRNSVSRFELGNYTIPDASKVLRMYLQARSSSLQKTHSNSRRSRD